MKLPSELRTNRLILKKPDIGYTDELYQRYASDSRITKYTTWEAHKSITESQLFMQQCINKWDTNQEFNFIVFLKKTEKLVGMCRIIFKDNNTASIGYAIVFQEWNHGYATELLKYLIQYIFDNYEITTINTSCDIDNKASQKVMANSGMKFIKILPKFVIHPNISDKPRDAYFYSISKQLLK